MLLLAGHLGVNFSEYVVTISEITRKSKCVFIVVEIKQKFVLAEQKKVRMKVGDGRNSCSETQGNVLFFRIIASEVLLHNQ